MFEVQVVVDQHVHRRLPFHGDDTRFDGASLPAQAPVRLIRRTPHPAASKEIPMSRPAIVLSRLDVERIENLLDRLPATEAQQHAPLRAELERAEVREPAGMPADVVTMNSTVTFSEESTGERITLALVYPGAAGKPGTVSILAPVGSALLGLARGQEIDWPMPGGQSRRLRVMEIGYQPEAAGDLHR